MGRRRCLLLASHALAAALTLGASDQPEGSLALSLHSTAFLDAPNEFDFYGIGGITYDDATGRWAGISEGNPGTGYNKVMETPRIYTFDINWEPYENDDSPRGAVDVLSKNEVNPDDGLKMEGIARVPSSAYEEFWLVSESNSNTSQTNSYFSKRFGHVDLNTFVPDSLNDSRLVRASSSGALLEDAELPEWLPWDGRFDWDMEECRGERVGRGLHSLTLYDPTEEEGHLNTTQLITANQIALYQDGPEPTLWEGSHVRIMFWDVNDDKSLAYSRTYRYRTSRLMIERFQKGARHIRGVFGVLAVSATEFLVTETEFFEGFGVVQFVSDVFYVEVNADDTVDHCDSLVDCDVEVPVKRHLVRRHHPYEMSDLAWGPTVDGLPTVAMTFEDDNVIGLLVELYTLNATNLSLEPIWESSEDSSAFIRQRTTVLVMACVVFGLGIIFQHWYIGRQVAKQQKAADADAEPSEQVSESQNESSKKMEYKDYMLVSALVNSCLLGGVVFGFPGLVMILRKEGIYAEVCSCGVFCAGQQEQFSVISTVGFASAIASRLFAGILLDKCGPKIIGLCSGIVSTSGLILLATAKDVTVLTDRITAAWIVIAVGGSSMHLTSFHITNLQPSLPDKRMASSMISAAFGAGSLVLPVIQIIHQYADVKLQTLSAIYACITALLTVNCFFIQPWRAFNSIGSAAELDLNFFRKSWWPSTIHELTIKRKQDTNFPTLRDVLRSFTFWGETFWFTSQLFLLTYYLSTISQILFALGDARVNQDVDSLLNNMFTRACVFFNGLGWLWAPLVGYTMMTKTIYFRVFMEIGMALVMALMLTVPVIEVQVVVFLLQALVRLQVFSNHFAYLGERFGFRHFGLLNGISSLVAGSFGLLGYVLQIFSVYVANGNYGLSYFIVAGLVGISCIFPILLKKEDQRKALEEEENEGSNNETQTQAKVVRRTTTGLSGLDSESEEVVSSSNIETGEPVVQNDSKEDEVQRAKSRPAMTAGTSFRFLPRSASSMYIGMDEA